MPDQWGDGGWTAGAEPDDGFEPEPPRRGSRGRMLVLAGMAVVLVLALVGVGVMVLGGGDPARVAMNSSPTAAVTLTVTSPPESPLPTFEESSAAPTASSPSPVRSSPSPKRSITPSKAPVQEALPPAPTRAPGTVCPTYPTLTQTKAQVAAELRVASGKVFWPGSAPSLRVPLSLLKAVGWQESGWQPSIVAVDCGLGTMQVMSDTATWMNNRFGTSWDVKTFSGNIMIGGQYLAWLIRYFGDAYYASVTDLGVRYDVLGNDGLLNSVIAGYNAGVRDVDPTKGTAGVPNWSYVNSVRALLTTCPCSAY
jgi:hypothetical protein